MSGTHRPPAGSVALVAAGGALGALARAAQNAVWPVAGRLPWATLAENVVGAFLLGWLLTVLTERLAARAWVRPLLGTGLLGSYTTYATVGVELRVLGAEGTVAAAVAYAAVTAVLGLAAAAAGIAAGRWRPGRPR